MTCGFNTNPLLTNLFRFKICVNVLNNYNSCDAISTRISVRMWCFISFSFPCFFCVFFLFLFFSLFFYLFLKKIGLYLIVFDVSK